MPNWLSFSNQEVQEMARQNRLRKLTEPGERLCSSCGEQALRFYYHELSGTSRIGTSYFWCPHCRKIAHSSGPRLSDRFDYDDPFRALGAAEFGSLETQDWYERLDKLWDSNVLPQRFVPKS